MRRKRRSAAAPPKHPAPPRAKSRAAAHPPEDRPAHEVFLAGRDVVQTLLDATSDRAFLVDLRGTILALNEAAARSLGKTIQEVVGRCGFNLMDSRLVRKRWPRIVQAIRARRPVVHEVERDGRYLVANLVPILGAKGKVIAVAIFAADVTERKRAEDALRAAELKYRSLIENIPAVTYNAAVDKASTTLFVSPQVEQLIGYTPREYAADPDIWRKRLHPDDRKRVLAAVARSHKTGERLDIEYRMIARDGRVVWVRDIANLVRDDAGRLVLLQGAMADITPRKQAEESLRMLHVAIECSGAPFMITDPKGILIHVNPAAVKYFGCAKAADLLGRSVLEFMPHSARGREILRTLREKGRWAGELDNTRKEGEVRVSQVSAALIRDEAGRLLGTVGSAVDITERKRAEEALRTHQRQLRMLASELSLAEEQERRRIAANLHDDVGQTLALAKMRVDLLRQSFPADGLPGPLEEIGRLIEQASRDMWTAIFDLSPPAMYELGLETALERQVREVAARHGLKAAFRHTGEPAPLSDDLRTVLFRAVRELLANIVRHARARKVAVRVQRTDDRIRVEVRDDGIGFDPAQLQARDEPCGGFGLFAIRERFSYLGGSAEIHSKPGRGTRVVLQLPLGPRRDERGRGRGTPAQNAEGSPA